MKVKIKSVFRIFLVPIIGLGCTEMSIPESIQTTPTAPWASPLLDTSLDTGVDTGVYSEDIITPQETAFGFGSALTCNDEQCWSTAPFGALSELYTVALQAQLVSEYPTGTGNIMSMVANTPILNGPEGLYDPNGLWTPLGQTGAISCNATQCATVLQTGLVIDGLTIPDRPKAIATDQNIWVWQNDDGQLESQDGVRSDWVGPEVYSMSVIADVLWIGSPQEGCVHRFDLNSLILNSSICTSIHGFGQSIEILNQNELLVGAPNAFGGKGYVGHWKDGTEIWFKEGTIIGESFGTSIKQHQDRLLIGAPSANEGRGLIYEISWP